MSIVHSPHERERHASQDSFVRAQQWVSELQTQGSAQIVIMVVGNKTDLAERRTVTKKEGEDYANANGLLFIETSAKTAENVNELFVAIGITIHASIYSFTHSFIYTNTSHIFTLFTHTHTHTRSSTSSPHSEEAAQECPRARQRRACPRGGGDGEGGGVCLLS